MIEVKFSLINDNKTKVRGILPKKAEELSTGYDVFNAGPSITLEAFEHALIPLGFKTFIPNGWWLYLAPRSSTHAKKHLHTLYGVIDESYEGQWFFSAQYIPTEFEFKNTVDDIVDNKYIYSSLTINYGDPIAQIIVMPKYEMDIKEISNDEFSNLCKNRNAKRGEGGFGSTH